MKMKRAAALLIASFLMIGVLAACGKNKETAETLLTEASENTKKTSSADLKITMDIDMTLEDPDSEDRFEASTSFQTDMSIVKEPLAMQADAVIRSACGR